MIKREIVDQLVDSWAYLEADAEHWQSANIGGPLEIEEPCWHIFTFHERPPWDSASTYKCGACGELKRVDDFHIHDCVPASYNLQKQGLPPHLHYFDNSMSFMRKFGLSPREYFGRCFSQNR